MKRALLVLPLILILLLVGCNFTQVKVVNLSFYIDGSLYAECTLSQYRKEGLTLPTKDGFTLSAWYTDQTMTHEVNWNKVKSDTALYANWRRDQSAVMYTVTFYDDEGEEIATCRASSVADITYPVMPHLADADFVGWEGLPRVLTQDIELYAVYVPVYSVTFLVEGVVYNTQRVREGESAERPANPTKPSDVFYNYAFTGWDQNFNNVQYDLEVKARFSRSAILYDVVFEQDDGTSLKRTQSEYGDRIVPPSNPTKAAVDGVGFDFVGWDINGDGVCDQVPGMVTGDLTARAVYDSYVMYYDVIFLSDGEEVYRTRVEYGEPAVYEGEEPRKAPDAQYTYAFDGWDVDFGEITEELTVNALFATTVNRYHYAFLDENGQVYVDGQGVAWEGDADYGSVILGPQEIPTKEMTAAQEFTFDAWRDEQGNAWHDGDLLVSNVQYQVQFRASYRLYTVTFTVDGHVYESYRYRYGDKVDAPALPEPEEAAQEGYHWECSWVGWSEGYRVTRDVTFVFLCEEVEDE